MAAGAIAKAWKSLVQDSQGAVANGSLPRRDAVMLARLGGAGQLQSTVDPAGSRWEELLSLLLFVQSRDLTRSQSHSTLQSIVQPIQHDFHHVCEVDTQKQ